MNSKKKAFTLIEILIVFAIIGVLASITLVYISNSRKTANGASFKKTMTSLKGAVGLCCSNTGNELPSVAPNNGGGGDICVPSVGSILPIASELTLGLGTVRYNWSTGYNCTTQQLLVSIINNTKNPACSNGATGRAYRVTPDKIQWWNPTAGWIDGFPLGC